MSRIGDWSSPWWTRTLVRIASVARAKAERLPVLVYLFGVNVDRLVTQHVSRVACIEEERGQAPQLYGLDMQVGVYVPEVTAEMIDGSAGRCRRGENLAEDDSQTVT